MQTAPLRSQATVMKLRTGKARLADAGLIRATDKKNKRPVSMRPRAPKESAGPQKLQLPRLAPMPEKRREYEVPIVILKTRNRMTSSKMPSTSCIGRLAGTQATKTVIWMAITTRKKLSARTINIEGRSIPRMR